MSVLLHSEPERSELNSQAFEVSHLSEGVGLNGANSVLPQVPVEILNTVSSSVNRLVLPTPISFSFTATLAASPCQLLLQNPHPLTLHPLFPLFCSLFWDTHRCSRVSKPEKAFLATDLILFPNRVLPFPNTRGVNR